MVGLGRLELPTSRLSGVRSNQLSYRPGSVEHEGSLNAQPDVKRLGSVLPGSFANEKGSCCQEGLADDLEGYADGGRGCLGGAFSGSLGTHVKVPILERR